MKKLKGFTLIELIIVMAIFGILMVGIVQMMKPIRSTYVDSTLYESQRSAQNGMVEYISESIRYATDLGFYTTDGGISSAQDAVNKFADAYVTANSLTGTEASKAKENVQKNAEIIVIDNKESYAYNGRNYTGRILRRKNFGNTTVSDSSTSSDFRLALGAAYYGERNCTIRIEDGNQSNYYENPPGSGKKSQWNAEDGIKITVSTTKTSGFDNRYSESSGVVTVTGEVVCKNLVSGGTVHGVNNAGMLDLTYAKNVESPSGTKYPYVLTTNPGTKIYIVYLNKDVSTT